MIVEVVSECLDVGNALLPPLGCEMSWEQNFALLANITESEC